MGGISIWQLLIVVVIVVLLFRDEEAELAGFGFRRIDQGALKKAMSDDEKSDKSSADADFAAKNYR